ncbi:MAG: phage tail assembly protein [Pseudomonadota bacterium]
MAGDAKKMIPNPYTLNTPVEFAGETIAEVTIRNPKISDHIAVSKSKGTEIEQEVEMMARLAGLNKGAVAEFDEHDFNQLSTLVAQMREALEEGNA